MATAIYRRRRFPWSTVLLGMFVLVLLLFVLAASGVKVPVISNQVLAWSGKEDEKPKKDVLPEGKVWVLRAARSLPAYHAIGNDDLLEMRDGEIGFARYAWKIDEVEEAGVFPVSDVRRIKGRVLKRNMDRGVLFSESDFFEKGTREGYTAGIPTGFLGLRVEVGDIAGMAGLTSGDRFDLVSVRKNEKKDKRSSKRDGLTGVHAQRADFLDDEEEEPDALVDKIVNNGKVVSGIQTRNEFETSTGLMSGAKTKATPKMEMFIAVRIEEATELVERLGMGAKVFCLPHSGRGESRSGEELDAEPLQAALVEASAGSEDEVADDESVLPEIEMIEVIRGDERVLETTIVPSEKSR